MFDSFYNNFIVEDRYRMILDGLQVTLLITAGAVVLGTLLGSRTFDAFLPIIVTAIIYFFMAWLIGRLLKSLVEKRYLQTLAAAAGLLIGATVCYVPEMFSSPVKSDEVTDAPAVFQALAGKNVGVVIGSIQDIAVTEMAPAANIQRIRRPEY